MYSYNEIMAMSARELLDYISDYSKSHQDRAALQQEHNLALENNEEEDLELDDSAESLDENETHFAGITPPNEPEQLTAYNLVFSWLYNGSNLNYQELQEMMSYIEEDSRGPLFRTWMEKEQNNISYQQLLEDLTLYEDETLKNILISEWLYKDGNNFSYEDLVEILQRLQSQNQVGDGAVMAWLYKNNFSYEQLNEIAQYFKEKNLRERIFFHWINKDENDLTFEQLEELLETSAEEENIEYYYRKDVILKWFEKREEEDPKEKFSDLKKLLNDGKINKNNSEEVGNLVNRIFNFYDLDYAVRLYDEIYPDDDSERLQLLTNFIHWNNDGLAFNEETIDALSLALNSVRNINSARSFVVSLREFFRLPSKDILRMFQHRVPEIYHSIVEQLRQNTVTESIKEEKLEELRIIFGADLAELTLLDLVVYFDVLQSNEINLSDFLKEGILRQIRSSYRLPTMPEDKCYILSSDDASISISSLGINFAKVNVITAYLEDKVNIKTIEDDEIDSYEITFPGDVTGQYDQDSRDFLNNRFRMLLKTEEASQDDIVEFIRALFKIDFDRITQDDREDFCSFFNDSNNKKQIAFILQQENGINSFDRYLSSRKDGCLANPANIFKAMIYEYSAKDNVEARILLDCYISHIFEPIINSGGDVLLTNYDPFNIRSVVESYIIPDGLIKVIDRKFKSSEERIGYIKEKLFKDGEENEFEEILVAANMLENIDDIAIYFILANVPDILNSAEAFRTATERHIKSLQEKITEFEEEKRKGRVEPVGDAAREARAAAALARASAAPLQKEEEKERGAE